MAHRRMEIPRKPGIIRQQNQFSYSSFLLQKGNSEIFIKCFSQWTLNVIILITFLNV